MIVTASEGHISEIVSLWQEAFGDEESYIKLFLKERSMLANTVLYLCDGRVCGMLFILPCNLKYDKIDYKCAYLSAVAASKSHRGRGIGTKLLKYAHGLCAERGYDLCVLVPASSSLFKYYADRGYAANGFAKTFCISEGDIETTTPIEFLPISASEVFVIRREAFGSAYIEWESSALEYYIKESELIGGGTFKGSIKGVEFYLNCAPSDDCLYIKEFSGDTKQIYAIAGALHKIYGKKKYIFRLNYISEIGELVPLAMTKWISKGHDDAFYLSYLLD